MTTTYNKPLPLVDGDTKEFWDACKRRELVIQKCQGCGQFRFPPEGVCPHCLSDRFQWQRVSGKGQVYTFSIIRRPPRPEFGESVPYVVGVVELAEGPRMISNVVGCPPEEVKIGMPVVVTFEDATEQITLPKFRPAP